MSMLHANKPKFQFQSKTLPSSPTHSSSSSFEFTISSFPTPDEAPTVAADELFYKGQLLPLHPSQRISMVRSLLHGSSSASASASSSTVSRDSSGSTSSSDVVLFNDFNCYSSRLSSVAVLDDDDEFIELGQLSAKKSKSFSFGKFASVFRKERKNEVECGLVKQQQTSVREVFRKYVKKVKPLYENMSQKKTLDRSGVCEREKRKVGLLRNSFTGRDEGVVASRSSCPASVRSSPYHYGASRDSAMEELQSAIQGAIAHCKNSMLQNKINS